MSDATVLHGGPIYEGELAVLIKAHIWGVHWLFGCYDFGPKTAKTQLAAAFACISVREDRCVHHVLIQLVFGEKKELSSRSLVVLYLKTQAAWVFRYKTTTE